MKAKEFIPASKPRNFVAKNQKTAGAGKHKDKKKAEKQGQVKHKGQIAEGSEQVYKVIAVDKSNALGRKVKLNVKADSVDEVFERLAMSDWYPLSINGEEVIDGRRLKPGVQEGSYTTEKQIKTRIRQIMYDRKLSGTESNAGELHRLKQQLKDIRSQQDVEEDSDWGEPREILEDVLQTLEREVEWPLTEVMDPKEVRQLLSPIVRAVNDKMMSIEEGRRDYGYDDFGNSLRPGDDEGSTEPPNNFAIYINGKKWKIFQGRGQFADDQYEMQQFRQLQSMAQRKSQETGKKWEVVRTGEPATK
jgi:hypothetical protein